MTNERGSGRTTRQIQDAPREAIFVWCNGRLDYARCLARHLGRSDLQIVSPQWLRLGSSRRFYFVVDHAAALSSEQRDLIHACMSDPLPTND